MTICMNFIWMNLLTMELLHHKEFQEPFTELWTRHQRLHISHYAGGPFKGSGVVNFTLLTQELNSRIFFSSLAGVLLANTQYEYLSEQLAYLSSDDLRFAGGLKHYKAIKSIIAKYIEKCSFHLRCRYDPLQS